MFFIMCCKKEESEGEVCSVDHRETYPVIISVDQRERVTEGCEFYCPFDKISLFFSLYIFLRLFSSCTFFCFGCS